MYPRHSGSSPLAVEQAQVSCRDLHRSSSISLLTPPSHVIMERAPPVLLWSMGSKPPPQLVRQNAVESIQKMKLCLKVIPHASSHTQLSAQPSSSADMAKRLTEAASTRSLRHQFNHRLVGTDTSRNSVFGCNTLFTSLLSFLHPT